MYTTVVLLLSTHIIIMSNDASINVHIVMLLLLSGNAPASALSRGPGPQPPAPGLGQMNALSFRFVASPTILSTLIIYLMTAINLTQ